MDAKGGEKLKRMNGWSRLHELDLSIEDQEFFTFVGPSGCGKSTALGLIAGLENETSGTIYFDDDPVSHLEPKDRDIAMVFQSYALYPHLNVFENVAFPLRIRKMSDAEVKKAVEAVAEPLGIRQLLDRRPRDMSGGQRQRVALARALIRRPKVFLMDEPLSNLDARLRIDMRTEIKRIHEKWRITTIYVTHDQEEAMVLSDRVAVMRAGRMQQCAPPLEIYRRPANRFVAEFVGTPPINIAGGDALLAAGAEANWGDHRPENIDVGIRPNDLRVAGDAGDAGLTISGTVELVEHTGGVSWLDVRAKDLTLRALAPEVDPPGPKDTVTLAIPKTNLLLFDKTSGERLES